MVNLAKSLFSNDQLASSYNESSSEIPCLSKKQLPFNKAFLTLALIESERTVSSSLDELDQCITNKCDLLSSDSNSDNDLDDRKVYFSEESPNMYSLSSISEFSEIDSSPLSLSSPYEEFSLVDFLPLNEKATSQNMDLKISDIDKFTGCHDDQSELLFRDKSSYQHNDESHDSDSESIVPVESILSADKNSFVCDDTTRDDRLLEKQTEIPKSILKNRVQQSDLLSEPIKRRHSEHRNPYFHRDVKSVSSLDNYLQPTIQRHKKLSVPARLPLKTLKHTLKANVQFLNSLKQIDDCSSELIGLLVKQAERLNGDIQHALFLTALKYSGIATICIFLTWASMGYLTKLIKSK